MMFPQKLKMSLPYDPAVPLQNTQKDFESRVSKNISTEIFIVALFTKVKKMETTQMSTDV